MYLLVEQLQGAVGPNVCFATCKQSPTCLLKTRRLADNHRRCFASRRWRCSLVQPLQRAIIDPVNWGFAQAALLSTIHHWRHLSCQRDRQVRCEGQQKTAHVAWEWALACSKTRESGAWEHSCILLSAAAVVTTSAVVSQRKTIYPCRFCDELIVSVFETTISTARPACRIRPPFVDAGVFFFSSRVSRNLMTAPPSTCARSRCMHPPPPCDLSRRPRGILRGPTKGQATRWESRTVFCSTAPTSVSVLASTQPSRLWLAGLPHTILTRACTRVGKSRNRG